MWPFNDGISWRAMAAALMVTCVTLISIPDAWRLFSRYRRRRFSSIGNRNTAEPVTGAPQCELRQRFGAGLPKLISKRCMKHMTKDTQKRMDPSNGRPNPCFDNNQRTLGTNSTARRPLVISLPALSLLLRDGLFEARCRC